MFSLFLFFFEFLGFPYFDHDAFTHPFIHSFRSFIRSFVHSFIQVISIESLQIQRRSRHSTYTSRSFTPKHYRQLRMQDLSTYAQGPYVAARAGFEHATLPMKGDESTNESPNPHKLHA